MDNKQLIKVIKALVEVEVAKKHEKFLKEQFPAILDEAVKGKMKTLKKTTTKIITAGSRSFSEAQDKTDKYSRKT